MYYSLMGSAICVFAGVIASFIAGKNNNNYNNNNYYSMHSMLSLRQRRCACARSLHHGRVQLAYFITNTFPFPTQLKNIKFFYGFG